MGEGIDGRTERDVVTAIEWIELAQDRIRDAKVTGYRWNNIDNIDKALKYLNEAKILIGEHQLSLSVKNEESLKTT